MNLNKTYYSRFNKDTLCETINDKYSDEKDSVIERADLLLEGVYVYQNEWDMERTNIPVTMPLETIDWNYSPTLDLEWSYMLHRHSYLMDLVIAYIFTKKEKYMRHLNKFLNKYVQDNIYNEENKNYSWRTIDTAIRLSNLVKINEMINILGYSFDQTVYDAMKKYYDYVYKNLLPNRIQSNWTAIEASGAITYAVAFKEDTKDLEYAVDYYSKCLRNQILPDGLQWEQSFMYHHEVLITALNVVQALKDYTPFSIRDITHKMFEASLKIMRVDFKQINYGDSDIEDMRSLMLSAEKILRESAFEVDVKSTLFDFIFTGNSRDGIPKPSLGKIIKNDLAESGIATINNYKTNSSLLFVYGPLGGGHGHDDLYHLDWFVNNKPFLVDSGRYTYYEENNSRLYFKHPQAHNTIVVDDKSFNTHRSAWSSTKVVTPMNEKVIHYNNISYLEGGHFGYSTKDDIVYVNRQVVYANDNTMLIMDSIRSNSEHKIASNFVFNKSNIEVVDNNIEYKDEDLEMVLHNLNNAKIKVEDARISKQYNDQYTSTRVELYDTLSKGVITTFIAPKEVKEIEIIPVYNDANIPYDKSIVECVRYRCENKYCYIMVQHEEPNDSRRAYIIDNELVYGRVIFMSKDSQNNVDIQVIH